jgi:signal transduction histidine kinase/DNA-binding response OmpR family regulator
MIRASRTTPGRDNVVSVQLGSEERERALVDALARQTALSEALKLVIGCSASPLDVVLKGLIESAVRLCRADWGVIYSLEEAKLRPAAFYGLEEERRAKWSGVALELNRRSAAGRCVVTRSVVEIPDVRLDAEYGLGEASRNVGWLSLLAVPLFRDDTLLGVFAVQRAQAGPFDDATALLSALADQAVIAIDNAHLFQQLQARTQELTQSVEELRALGEISQAVSSSLELETVLDTVVQASVRLARVDSGTIYTLESANDEFVPRASSGLDEETLAAFRHVIGEARDNVVWQATSTRRAAQVSDIETSPMSEATRVMLRRAGFQALLAVPMVRAGQVVGALVVRRRGAGEFPGTVVRLLETFATQSAIAVDNARLFREIQDKGRELKLASQHKSQFLANMSHELRTPLNAIIGVTEMLHEDARDLKREDEIEPLERVLRAGRHLLALINDILDLSKIEAGKMDLYVETFALAPLIEDVVNTTNTLAAKNGNRVVVNCPIDIGAMRSDQTRIRQALLNLASNAAKFTEKGTITIDAKRTTEVGREWITIAVTDSGIGMTPEQVGRLFQDFTQADASTTRKYGGTGLGLAISQRFCRMMGGDITVESAPGRGSSFILRLPAEVAGPGESAEVHAAVASSRVGGCNLILVVDDDETMRDLMDRFLSKEGFTVAKASGGREGLKLAHELRPDAITLDVMMPDLDGWTVLAAIKGDPELADTPVILMTILDEKTRGFALGAAEFMVKPVDRERLATTLKKLCSSAGRRVLVVDDDQFVRNDVQRSLEREGWQVTQAENGQIALARLAEWRPDIIVLDLMMPEMDGFEFLAALRDRTEWHDIPVLVVTARDLTPEDRSRLTGGVKRIIPKGTSGRDELLREVARLLKASVKREASPEMESTI